LNRVHNESDHVYYLPKQQLRALTK